MELTESMFRYLAEKVCGSAMISYNGTVIDMAKPFERISMIDAVEQVAKMMDNKIIRDGLLDAKTQVAKGIPLSKPLKDMEMLPPMLSAMTKIGEETGDIEEMLSKVADYYDEEVEEATNKLTAAMEPLIMVVLACIVGMIVAAVYGPIMSMYSALDQY